MTARGDFPSFYCFGPANSPAPVWNFMKTVTHREAAVRPEPRTQTPRRVALSAVRPAQTDWAWPGMTRAELRAEVIDQIG